MIKDQTNQEYHEDRTAFSKSDLDQMLKGFDNFNWYRNAPVSNAKENSLSLGTLVHESVLENEKYAKSYVVEPKVDGRTKEGKATKEQFERLIKDQNLSIISQADSDKVKLITDSVYAHPLASQMLNWKQGKAEVSIYCHDNVLENVQLKIRPDYINVEQGYIIDLKTTSDLRNWNSSAIKYGYDLQAELYKHIAELNYGKKFKFYFIVVSTELELGRYPVEVRELDSVYVEHGRELMRNAINLCDLYIRGEVNSQILITQPPQWFLNQLAEREL